MFQTRVNMKVTELTQVVSGCWFNLVIFYTNICSLTSRPSLQNWRKSHSGTADRRWTIRWHFVKPHFIFVCESWDEYWCARSVSQCLRSTFLSLLRALAQTVHKDRPPPGENKDVCKQCQESLRGIDLITHPHNRLIARRLKQEQEGRVVFGGGIIIQTAPNRTC